MKFLLKNEQNNNQKYYLPMKKEYNLIFCGKDL